MSVIVQLLPDQIAEHWDLLKIAIMSALPPTANNSNELSNNILHSLLAGGMACWVAYSSVNGVNKISLITTTAISEDLCSGTRSLLIYTLFGHEALRGRDWEEGINVLAKYGRSKGCSRIVGYTDLRSIKKIVEIFGGEARFTFISIPI
jgi:hypothetical protein